ncbi:MAG TPA: hypothetical protein VEL76_26230, partial [Gemmataceae bacterium]|nr:hypothetical protein [Gemmataceae bacterium]
PPAAPDYNAPTRPELQPADKFDRIIHDQPSGVGYLHPDPVHLLRHTSEPVPGSRRRAGLLLPQPTIRTWFAAASANHQAHQPELVRLREQLTAQRAEASAVAGRNAGTIRALEQTITTYANQIQTLAPTSRRTDQDNQRLREQLSRSGNIRTLPTTAESRTTTSRR